MKNHWTFLTPPPYKDNEKANKKLEKKFDCKKKKKRSTSEQKRADAKRKTKMAKPEKSIMV